ncbi:MAG: ROK family protein [Eubacteriales bacterium]|nr:ROK family protein [Eubacteriales bacterium]
MMQVKSKSSNILALDIGGTACKFCMAKRSTNGEITLRSRAELIFDNSPEAPGIYTQLQNRLPTVIDEVVDTVAISATGQIDIDRGIVVGTAGHLKDWQNSDLKALVRPYCQNPDEAVISVINDVNAAALGEARHGAGRGIKQLLMITLGTGVGGGLIVDGKLLLGAHGLAGELGHVPIFSQNPKRCSCGLLGCIETRCSTRALIARSQEAGHPYRNGREFITALTSDSTTQLTEIWETWIEDIAYALAGLSHLLNPERIIIGGGISEVGPLLIDSLWEALEKKLMPAFAHGLSLRAAELGNLAGLYGAIEALYS